MNKIVWAGNIGWVHGLGPGCADNMQAALPESVEDQLGTIVAHLDSLLANASLDRSNLLTVTVHLTQFPRFEKRASRALDRCLSQTSWTPEVNWLGVTHLARDALVQIDARVLANPA
jgi:enamine deaminase RidA (YjgF/YER057c/UK114 family)